MKSVTGMDDGQNRDNQLAVHRWFWRSVLLLSSLCAGAAVFSVQQYMEYYDLHQEYAGLKSGTAELHTCLERKRQLKEQTEKLQAQLTKINGIKYRPKNPATLLAMLADISADVTLQDVALKKKQLDLVLFAQDTKAIPAYADRLRAHALCAQVDTVAIEQAGDRIKALLHVVLN